MYNFFHRILNFISRLIGKKILYTKEKKNNTAVYSDFGFWYAGDVFDIADIAYGVVQNGMVESYSTFLLYNIVKDVVRENKKAVFYDVGANTGFFGILAQSVHTGKVTTHFFEPIKEYLDCIKSSVYLNRYESTSVINNVGVAEKEGSLTFHIQGSGTTADPDFINNKDGEKRKVNVLALDSYVYIHKNDIPDIVKIDVEGFEYQVLLGAEKLLKEDQPILYVEIAQTLHLIGRAYRNKSFENIFALLERLGYVSYLIKDNSLKMIHDYSDFKIDGIHMYLFLNKKKHQNMINNVSDVFLVEKL